MRVLLSGFQAFNQDAVNPTEKLMQAVAQSPEGYLVAGMSARDLLTVVLPVEFGRAFTELQSAIRQIQPDVVVAFGLAAGRSSCIELEHIAVNLLDSEISDNSGTAKRDAEIIEGAPLALPSTLPLRKILAELQCGCKDLGIAAVPAKLSCSAGTYVCNDLFFRLQHSLQYSKVRSGFVHIPYLPEQVAGRIPLPPSLAFSTLQSAVRLILRALT